MWDVAFCIDSDNKAVIRSPKVHHSWRTSREKVRSVKECDSHTKGGEQHCPFKSSRDKIGNGEGRFTTDVHGPIVYQEIIHQTEYGCTTQAAEHESRVAQT